MTAIMKSIEILGGPSKFAASVGVTTQAACFWRDGKRRLPIELCSVIERATEGAVTRRDLRPNDWHLIWPELVTATHPAPQPQEQEAA